MKLLLKGNKVLTSNNKPLTVPSINETIRVTVGLCQNQVTATVPTPTVTVQEVE